MKENFEGTIVLIIKSHTSLHMTKKIVNRINFNRFKQSIVLLT